MAAQALQGAAMIQLQQFQLYETGELPSPNIIASGISGNDTSGTTLVDPLAHFITAGIVVGDIVCSSVGQSMGLVVEVVSETELIVRADQSPGGSYTISHPVGNEGCLLYVSYGGVFVDLRVETVGGDTVTIKNIPSFTFLPIHVKKAYVSESFIYGLYAIQ
jgi:hypothetical protein